MTIVKEKQGAEFTVWLEGRLDTVSAPDFETVIRNELGGVETLILDFKKLQ